MRIEEYLSERLVDPDERHVKGIIFLLKCQFGWRETKYVEYSQQKRKVPEHK